MTNPSIIILVLLLSMSSALSWAQAPDIKASTAISTAGYFQLNWQGQKASSLYQLEESANAQFTTTKIIYEGHDTASIISGRSNGEYLYRVREIDTNSKIASEWSTPITISVKHHSLSRALGFFFIGLIVFISTLIAIVRGSKRFSIQG